MPAALELPGLKHDTVTVYRQAVARTIRSMADHLDDDFSLEDMAKIGFMSPYHFNRVFRQVTGVPPVRFLGARRLEAAKRLLLTTSMRVTDICFEVGYNSLGTFTRRFTDLVGVPPNRFRAMADREIESTVGSFAGSTADNPSDLEGQISAPDQFAGLIFVGLFKTAIPQGQPLASAVLPCAGRYRIQSPGDGHFFAFALGLVRSRDPKSYLLYDKALRAGNPTGVRMVAGELKQGSLDLELRPAEPFDPPILMTFPWLARERSRNSHGARDRPQSP